MYKTEFDHQLWGLQLDSPYWLRWLRWQLSKKHGTSAKKTTEWRFEMLAHQLGPGDVAIDCGANVGRYTALLAKRGATVYAFEPDPVAYEVLALKFASWSNVILANKAVGLTDGSATLYRHVDFSNDPVAMSSGSSLLRSKVNIDPGCGIIVYQIDFVKFVKSIQRPISILKIDVEGAEVDLLNALIDTDCLAEIGAVIVEMHDHKIPEIVDASAKLRARIVELNFTNVSLDWR